jgi:hypothetical protein
VAGRIATQNGSQITVVSNVPPGAHASAASRAASRVVVLGGL